METKIVGCGRNPGFYPFIPDFLLLECQGEFCLQARKEIIPVPKDDPERIRDRLGISPIDPTDPSDGSWLCIWEDKIEWFPLSDEERFRTRQAALLHKSAEKEKDPLSAIFLLRAAAAMVGIDLASLQKEIQEKKRPDEGLYEAYLRIKSG